MSRTMYVLLFTVSQSLFDCDSNQTGIGNTYCGRLTILRAMITIITKCQEIGDLLLEIKTDKKAIARKRLAVNSF